MKQVTDGNVGETVTRNGFHFAAYLLDMDWLKEAYWRSRKDGDVGVDGVNAEDYEQDLERNLQSLLDRAKSGAYKAAPVSTSTPAPKSFPGSGWMLKICPTERKSEVPQLTSELS